MERKSPDIGHWRLRQQRYRLIGEQCNGCGGKMFPPRDICPHCAEPARTPFKFSGRGRVWSHSKVYDAPEGYETQAPYTVALVELEEGPLIATQLTDISPGETVKIGDQVEMVVRKLREDGPRGIIVYGYKFRPPVLNRAE